MTLREYLDVARVRWRLLVAGLLTGLAVAGAVTLLTPRQYAADVTVFVSARSAGTDVASAFEGNQLSAQRMRTYLELLQSRRLAREVVDDLDLTVTAEDLAGRITATTAPDTVLLTATVTDSSPERAVDIANAVADRFIEDVAELEQPDDPLLSPVVTALVFEEAAPPVPLVAPKPALYLALGALLGLLAGLAAALLRTTLDASITSRSRLGEVAGAPVLAVFAHDATPSKHALAVRDTPGTPLAEAARQLRTNLRSVDVDREHRVVLVTSPSPGEGSTTTVCHLGLALAAAGIRVLLVEADLRRPALAGALDLDGGAGLTDVLATGASVTATIQQRGPCLDVLPCGPTPPNPSELLGSPQMDALLAQVRESYDVVLIDTPPILPVTDAAVLASRADGVVLVVRHGATTENQVRAAREALDAVSARLLGTVLTMVPRSRMRRYRPRGRDPYGRPPEPPAGAGTGRGGPVPEPPTQPIHLDGDSPNGAVSPNGAGAAPKGAAKPREDQKP